MLFEPIKGRINKHQMISDDVLELGITFDSKLKILPGQWIGILLRDESGNFIRPYSIADFEYEDGKTNCFFIIKILENGRGTKIINSLKVGDEIKINGVFGHFVLKENHSKKVFIATGTGIAPIINMLKKDQNSEKTLFFGVQYKKDIIWEEKIKKIKKLDYKIFLSRENIEGYQNGRIDLNKFDFGSDTEFYICGAPPIVENFVNILKYKGFEKIYYEQFF